MGDTSFEIKPEQTFVLRIIWAAIVAAQLLIHGVFWYLRLEQGPPAPPPEVFLYVLVAVGTALPLLAGFVARAIARTGFEGANAAGPLEVGKLFPAVIVNLALRESGGIFAAVALFLGADPVLWAVPAAVALGATLVAYPSEAVIRRLAPDTSRRLG